MNKKTLQKVIDELNKDNPRLDYVRGILETLIEQEDSVTQSSPKYFSPENATLAKQELDTRLTAAEQAALLAEQGFVKGTKPGVVTETNVILK